LVIRDTGPDLTLKEPQCARYPVAGVEAIGQPLAPFGQRAADRFGLGFSGHPRHFGREPLGFLVLSTGNLGPDENR
jgi:hypothetical protein